MLTVLLSVAIAPAVICAIVLLATGALKPAHDARLAWSLPLAVALGVAVAELGGGTQHIPPVEASDWFIPIAVAIAVIAFVRTKIPVWPLRIGLAIAVVGVICYPLFGGAWTATQGLAWCSVIVAVIAVSAWGVERAAGVAPGVGLPAALVVIATGAAVAVAVGGSAHYGQAIGAVASAVGPLIVLGLIRRDAVLARAAWAPFYAVASVVVAALVFVDVPVLTCLLLMIGFASLPLADIAVLARRPRWQREVLRVGVACALVAIAIVMALPSTSADGY